MKSLFHCLIMLLVAPIAVLQGADLQVSGVFADNMVLQRDKPVPVWGWSAAGDTITVSFAGQSKTAKSDTNGKWMATLDPLPANGEPRKIAVHSAQSPQGFEIHNVLVGDVFVLAGQSNMGWDLAGSKGGKEAARHADYPWLRFFEGGYQAADEPAQNVTKKAKWRLCTPDSALQFSGIGFFFADALHLHIRVPIGLVQTAIAATYGENWISRTAMQANPELRYALDAYEKALEELPAKQKEWEVQKADHDRRVAEAKAAGKAPPVSSDFIKYGPMGPKHPKRPNAFFNGRVAPLMPLAVRGVIWYQGEGNVQIQVAERYNHLLTTLIQSWRTGFIQEDLPFFIVQLPRYTYDYSWISYPLVREAQLKVSLAQRQCGLVVLMDEGENKEDGTGEIHPKNKRPVGERLARLARAMIFNEPLVPTGPLLERHEIRDGAMWLYFRNAGDGLRSDGGDLQTFTLCGADQVFHPARAEIVAKDTLRVTSGAVAQPMAARYAWAPFPDCNLFNSDGLPASPFRTDDFDVGHYLPRELKK